MIYKCITSIYDKIDGFLLEITYLDHFKINLSYYIFVFKKNIFKE